MNWFSKALVFKTLSAIPGGGRLYRHAQWNWTKSIVANPERVGQKLAVGMDYLKLLLEHGHSLEQIRSMRHLDLGCGWHPTIPLLFYRIGMRDQILTDVPRFMTSKTFLDSLKFVNELLESPNHPARELILDESDGKPPDCSDLDALLARHRMEYHAPYFEWARTAVSCIDLVTCTQVLLYIERSLLDECFKTLHRLMLPGGLFIAPIHLYDLYSDADPKISRFNHLRYSRSFWKRIVDSDMMSFNRLKSRDYREALEGAGFEIIDFRIEKCDPESISDLQSIEIHSEFRERYSEEELSETHLFFVARKP